MVNARTFQDSLSIANHYSTSPVWESIYKKVFPDFHQMIDYSHNGIHQKRGVDRLVLLKDSTAIKIDEKIRISNFDDVALEYASVVKNGEVKALGWVCDPEKDSDYIAYAISPLGIGWCFPYKELRRAWNIHGNKWIEKYRNPKKHIGKTKTSLGNIAYETYFCPVPAKDIYKAMYVYSQFEFRKNAL